MILTEATIYITLKIIAMENYKVKAVAFVYPTPRVLLPHHKPQRIKDLNTIIGVLKRISPFLIIAFCLPVVFTCLLMKDIYSGWLLAFFFVFVQVNILTIDFAIWNYHKGNKIWRMWLIEMSVAGPVLYFII